MKKPPVVFLLARWRNVLGVSTVRWIPNCVNDSPKEALYRVAASPAFDSVALHISSLSWLLMLMEGFSYAHIWHWRLDRKPIPQKTQPGSPEILTGCNWMTFNRIEEVALHSSHSKGSRIFPSYYLIMSPQCDIIFDFPKSNAIIDHFPRSNSQEF